MMAGLSAVGALNIRNTASLRANPIRKVVNMLQAMSVKVQEEGKRDDTLHEKYMCYCSSGTGDLEKSIQAAGTKITMTESAIKEGEARHAQLKADLVAHKADRADAQKSIATATAIRSKDAAIFAKDSSDHKQNIAALGKAIAALEKGATGFLQTSSASVIRRLSVEMDLSNVDRDLMSSFLSQGEGYAPQSGQITGILKEMSDTMKSNLADMTSSEETAKANFQALVAAKEAEIAANTEAIESKTVAAGELAVQIVNSKELLDDTTKAKLEDEHFLADLQKNCNTKSAEYDVVVKTRNDENVALAETIRILNDDESLELFKKVLPSTSLLQVKMANKQVRANALLALHAVKANDPRLDLVSLALRGKDATFGKVVKMIESMVALLGKEQGDDNEQKAYCETAFDRTDDEAKSLDQAISDLGKAIEDFESRIATLKDDIAMLTKGVKDLDEQVAEATSTREAEHSSYTDTMAADQAAIQVIGFAKNRMNRFYNPAMYVEAPKRQLSQEDAIVVGMGGTAPPTPAPGGIAGTGVTVLVQDAPAPPPEAVRAYQKKGEESTGVIAMLDLLVADLDKEMQALTTEEKDSQAEFEALVHDSAAKRMADVASIATNEGAKADTEAAMHQAHGDKTSRTHEFLAKQEEIGALHQTCDWLLANFENRKAARSGEIESLKNAKAVLSGADYSLLQASTKTATIRQH